MINPLHIAVIGALAIVTALAWLIMFSGPPSSAQPITCIDPTIKEQVRVLMLEALDNALRERVEHQFDIWMREPDRNQPARAATGTRTAVRAYADSRKFVQEWNPPPC